MKTELPLPPKFPRVTQPLFLLRKDSNPLGAVSYTHLDVYKRQELYLKDHDITGLDIQHMSQVRAMRYTLERVVRGLDTISVTGNILRDYLTCLLNTSRCV